MYLIDYSATANNYDPTAWFGLTSDSHCLVKPFVQHTSTWKYNVAEVDDYVGRYDGAPVFLKSSPYEDRHVGIMVFLRGSPVEHYGFSVRLREETWT